MWSCTLATFIRPEQLPMSAKTCLGRPSGAWLTSSSRVPPRIPPCEQSWLFATLSIDRTVFFGSGRLVQLSWSAQRRSSSEIRRSLCPLRTSEGVSTLM